MTHRKDPIWYYRSGSEYTWEQWQWRGTLHSLKPQHYWSLTIRFRVICRTLVAGVLLFCRDAVSVFYSPTNWAKRSLWCNGYRHWKWTQWSEFNSRTKQFTFHIVVIALGIVWLLLFSLSYGFNSRADCVVKCWYGNRSWRRKTLNSNLKIIVLHPHLCRGVGKYKYGGCDKVVHLNEAIVSLVLMLVCHQALTCWRWTLSNGKI